MAHAQTCPICNGKGKIKDPNYDPAATGVQNDVVCHGCGGKGWVEVKDDSLNPWRPYPEPEPWHPWRPYRPWRYGDDWHTWRYDYGR